jgi:hypothetical protein
MVLVLYWAASTGLWDEVHNPFPYEKKSRPMVKKAFRRLTFHFKRGLRCIMRLARVIYSAFSLGIERKLMDGKLFYLK